MTFKYRADIDGLRAVAILPVVLYHFDIPPFSGGFVGVDVFFVISGFLITSLISQELQEKRFSIAGFYDRRIRRIAPALILVLTTSALAALWLFLPTDLEAFGRSLRAAVGMFSNIHFLREAGYFAVESARKPLLHTWSLSVEEQFYLAFPILIWLLHYLRLSRFIILTFLLLLLAASLAKSSIAALEGPGWAFFQTQYRLWELLMGSALALANLKAPVKPQLREGLAALGLGMIVIPVFLYSSDTPFPGLAAVPPCLGVVLILYTGMSATTTASTATQRLLSFKPMVFIGLISYSLYLWHWPIIVFANYVKMDPLGLPARAALLAVSIVISILSWRYVEQPFRDRARISRKLVFGLTAAMALALAAAGTFFAASGLPNRFSRQIVTTDAYQFYDRNALYRTGKCYLEKEDWNGFDRRECLTPASGRYNLLVLGDSHAAHYVSGLRTVLGGPFNVMQATAECEHTLPQPPHCRGSANHALAFLRSHRIDAVILSAAWQPHNVDLQALRAMVTEIRKTGARVIVFGPSINYRVFISSAWARWLAFGDGPFVPEKHRWPDDMGYDQRMEPLINSAGGHYVSILKAVCPKGKCPLTTKDGKMLQFDGSHLTAEGSESIILALWRNGSLSQALGLVGQQSPSK